MLKEHVFWGEWKKEDYGHKKTAVALIAKIPLLKYAVYRTSATASRHKKTPAV
jgi:hypothetical protein